MKEKNKVPKVTVMGFENAFVKVDGNSLFAMIKSLETEEKLWLPWRVSMNKQLHVS